MNIQKTEIYTTDIWKITCYPDGMVNVDFGNRNFSSPIGALNLMKDYFKEFADMIIEINNK
jgi:hypothetical protein